MDEPSGYASNRSSKLGPRARFSLYDSRLPIVAKFLCERHARPPRQHDPSTFRTSALKQHLSTIVYGTALRGLDQLVSFSYAFIIVVTVQILA